MTDPLSITASAAGLVSLGLTVCSGLLDYYRTWKDQHSDISTMCESLEILDRTFELLDEKVHHPLLDRKSVDRVTESIISCAAGVQGLKAKLDKVRNTKPGMSARIQRAQYPFQQKTLGKLMRTVSDLRGNLDLATSTLHLDVSISSLHRLNEVNTGIRELRDKSEISSTKILDSISRLHLDSEERDVIRWLCSIEFCSKHNDAQSRRQEGTGRWLLESHEFRSWLDTAGKVIWCPGIPGAGKTILASTVIDHLEQYYRREQIGIAYVYCVYNSPNQTTGNFLGSLLQQLAMQSVALSDDVKSCHKHHAQYGTRPSINETAKLLRSQVEKFDKVFIVIDALDECPELEQTRKTFLAEIRGLFPKVRLLVTSRNIPSIENMFKNDTRIDIRAQDQDIRKFIESQMDHRDELVALLEGHDDVRSDITLRVLEKTNGMFLIAALHIDSLAKEDNIRDLEESLQSLPEDLDRTYDDALERIKHQDSRKRARADQVLMLISCTKRPLILAEMRQALSIRKGDTFLDSRALPKTESLISTCCGLVVVEDKSQIVRLVHYTTEEYFRRKLPHYRSPEAHGYFAGILITYLSFSVFATFSQDKMIEDLIKKAPRYGRFLTPNWDNFDEEEAVKLYMRTLLESNILISYAAHNWGHHARIACANFVYDPGTCLATAESYSRKTDNLWDLQQLIPDFLGRKPNLACANEVLHSFETKLNPWTYPIRSPTDITDLQLVASFGIRYFVELYLNQGAEVDARDSEGMTALHKAAKNGHLEIVRLLLESGAAIQTLDREGRSALVWATIMNKISVSRLLLQYRVDSGSKNIDDRRLSAISIAAESGHGEILELLAEYETDYTRLNQVMRDALLDAVYAKREGIVCLILRDGKRWAISKHYIVKVMSKAALYGHIRIIKILLEAGVDVNCPLPSSSHPHAEAADHGQSEVTQDLLAEGPASSLMDDGGNLPLHAAVRQRRMTAVTLLLESGADVNALNSDGETAIVVLAKGFNSIFGSLFIGYNSSLSLIQQLLEKGADTTARDCVLKRTSLEWAIFHGNIGIVQLLLQRESLSVARENLIIYLTDLYNAIHKRNERAVEKLLGRKQAQGLETVSELLLIHIPAEAGFDDVVIRFLQSGAAIEAKTPYGGTALYVATEAHNIATMELLLRRAANTESRTISGDTPLVYAAREGNNEAVTLLLDHGAHMESPSVDTSTSISAITGAAYGGSRTMRLLLERGADPNFRDIEAYGGTLLHIVSRNQPGGSQTRSINLLLEYGADLEARDEEGKTPLAAAVEDDTFEAMPILLESGANLEARDNNGRTPLGAAIENGVLQAVHLFLEHGADLEARDNNGHTPLVLAIRFGRVQLVEYLLERGANPEAFSPTVTVENEKVYDYDFEKAVKIVLEAQSNTR